MVSSSGIGDGCVPRVCFRPSTLKDIFRTLDLHFGKGSTFSWENE